MQNSFFKYQSLGNDFVVFDWYTQPQEVVQKIVSDLTWAERVMNLCNRHVGVGADNVLVITKREQHPLLRVFNADGSEAESCLNGLRCVAEHLMKYHDLQEKLLIRLGQKDISCERNHERVCTVIPGVRYEKSHVLNFSEGQLQGHQADAGNPHFMVFQETTVDWLARYGKELESHPDFPRKSNISFLWQVAPMVRDDSLSLLTTNGANSKIVRPEEPVGRLEEHERLYTYNMLTFERGCGITQACSSAAAAALKTLYHLGKIRSNQEVEIKMLGGTVVGLVNHQGEVVLQAGAYEVFKGQLV